jgi:hypothetical protein
MEKELGPFGTGQGPFVLITGHEFVDMPHLQLDPRLSLPAVLLAFEKMVEKALLQRNAIVRIEFRPMRPAVQFEPFVRRWCPEEAFNIAPQMQALAAPIARN